ncbi:hypothetical protein CLOM_g18589 [Closterium sp. NIES-68]|nr:hypothetical protein CLOM_g18589 [Closterium sp. NIES-68]GJP78638.1 hypothetical protein CLOP_g8915 [Closterium sp. NIES-67]
MQFAPAIRHPNATQAILTVALGLSSIRPVSFANKQSYCNRHGIECIFVTTPVSNRTPVWQKVELLARYLPRYEWIWLLDLDAIITNKSVSISDIVANAQARSQAQGQQLSNPLIGAGTPVPGLGRGGRAAGGFGARNDSSARAVSAAANATHPADAADAANGATIPATHPHVDLIYARDYEDRGLNAGSLFFRRAPRFLETDFFPHWLALSRMFHKRELEEQGALADMLQRDYKGVRGASVRLEMQEINSYCPEHEIKELRWRRGDLVAHFPGQCKKRLVPFVRRNWKEILD